MKQTTSVYVYIALLFLIFLVAIFPYKEGFEFSDMYNKDKPTSNKDISRSDTNFFNTDISGSKLPYLPYSF